MESYCVIHFKDKPEKIKILTLLAVETEAKYHVTTDLMEYVAKMFGVTILENNEENMKNVNFDAATIQNVVQALQNINPTNNITSPLIDTLPTEQQHSSTPIVPSTPIVEQPRAIETTTVVKGNAVNKIVGVVTTTVDTISTEQQHPSTPIVVPTPIDINVVNQQVPVVEQQIELIETVKNEETNNVVVSASLILDNYTDTIPSTEPITIAQPSPILDNQQNLMIGTYVPYRDRMIEPKQERIEDEMAVAVEHSVVSNLVEMDEDATEENMATNEDAPSSSRRPGRITKRPNYSIDDDAEESALKKKKKKDASSTPRQSGKIIKKPKYRMDDVSDKELENMPETEKKSNNNQASVTRKEKVADECQKCGTVYSQYRDKEYHVMSHAKIMRYECLVAGCGSEAVRKGNIVTHMKKKHMANWECFREIELTGDQKAKLEEVRKECYPEQSNDSESECRVCHQNVGGTKYNSSSFKRHRKHALHHIGFMLYKCMENRCQFECKEMHSIVVHMTKSHGESARENFQTNKLTKEQESEIEEMVSKCFPNINTNREVEDSEE